MTKEIACTTWTYNADGTITIEFLNCITGMVDVKTYKTGPAARAAETKFHNKASRVYGNVNRPAADSYYPYM